MNENVQKIQSGLLYDYNLVFLDNIKNILKIKGTKYNPFEIRDKVTSETVREINKIYAFLWNLDVSIENILPEPDPTILRALYTGMMRPEVILRSIVRNSLYTDEIFVVSPFTNPNCMAAKYNPLKHPEEHIDTTLKNVFFMLNLEPWIRAGIVKVIPEPGDFDYSLRTEIFKLAEERYKSIPEEALDIEEEDEVFKRQDLSRVYLQGPTDYLIRRFREVTPTLKDKSDAEIIKEINVLKRNDPLCSPYIDVQKNPQLITTTTGTNLEMSLFIRELTGCYLYTDMRFRWMEILSSVGDAEKENIWSPLSLAFQNLDFKFLDSFSADFAYRIKTEGRLLNMRNFLRKLWQSTSSDEIINEEKVRTFIDELKDTFGQTKEEYDKIDADLRDWLLSKETIAKTAIAFLSGDLKVILPTSINVVTEGVGKLVESHSRRKLFKNNFPLSVFLELSKQKNIQK